mmetsp:Transcript_71216/g.189350  ORF Transcript_71216/g.189350 Transcript_71216/m.189350 type:complete len:221 (+) Transcript_71216:241-903(+)
MQAAVSRRIDSVGVGSAVEQQLHDGDAIGTNRVAQRRDALVILHVKGLGLGQKVLHGFQVTVLGGLVQGEGRLVELLEHWCQLCRKAPHLLAELQHELLILVVFHGGLETVLLDVLQDGSQLWILLQCLDAVLDRRVVVGQLLVVVLSNRLCLQPPAHGVGVFGKLLEGLGRVGVALHIRLHLRPCRIIDAGDARYLHGATIADGQCLRDWGSRHRGTRK